MRFLAPIILVLLLAVSGRVPAAQSSQQLLLSQPVTARLLEFPSQALPIWAAQQEQKPTLLLLSQDPFLQQVPRAAELLTRKKLREMRSAELDPRLSPLVADPLLLPRMTIRAAIDAGYFASVVWVFPAQTNAEHLDLELFRRQLLESKAVSAAEAETFTLQQDSFSGTLSQTPFRAVPLEQLSAIGRNLLLHIDLSYFSPLYKGEIKTPLYPLLFDQLKKLQSLKIGVLGVTISRSNLDGNLPLATRFIAATLEQLLAEPKLLEQPLPEAWELRRKALYLGNFFQREMIDQLYRQLLDIRPQDAAAHYARYQNLRELKRGNEALRALARATELDSAYAFEYLQLVQTALEKGRPDEGLRMFSLAEQAFPDNPFVKLQKAELLRGFGWQEQVEEILRQLQNEPWSEIYYPEMARQLEKWLLSD